MALDLGGIAKGYAADAALNRLTQLGFPAAMVSASGDLALGDPPPGKRGWTIELAPFGDATAARTTLVLVHAAVSTSGDAEQFVEIGGVRFSHIIDPITGLGLTRSVAVTVVARRATVADALATALQALRPHVLGRLIVVFGAGGDRDRGKRPLMGAAAAAHADVLYVTDDNPRSEDAATIRAAILAACPGASEVGDRAEAILRGVDALLPGDALLIAGKGHESGQIIKGDIYPFDDVEQASVAVSALDGVI
jgi:hypothetical protein